MDPRPELHEDTLLWHWLLRFALDHGGPDLFSRLRVARWCRTRIVWRGPELRMAGEVDLPMLGGWASKEEWTAWRDEHLRPWTKELAALLVRVRQRVGS